MVSRPFRGCSLLASLALTAGAATAFADTDIEHRINCRGFPSIFQAWSPADNQKHEDPVATFARHDLAIEGPEVFGLQWNNSFRGLADGFQSSSVEAARVFRASLLRLNPNMVLIAEVRYRDAPDGYLPASSPWWKREDGVKAPGWAEGHYFRLDYSNADFRSQIAKQSQAIMATGIFDGVFFDWWNDDDDRVALIKAVRIAVGDVPLILANVNERPRPLSSPYINGYYMECTRTVTPKDWSRIASTLQYAEQTLRKPRVNCLETWFHNSRQDLNLMRATTTLALTMSDGYCLFGDPDALPTPDHLHDWYDFWDRSLGKPLAPGIQRADGSWQRNFEGGTAIYNPMGNGVSLVKFESQHRRLSTGKIATQFAVPPCDGDIFLSSH